MIYLAAYDSEDMGPTAKRQQEHILGRTLLETGLQREYALFLPELSLETGAHGKPFLPEYPHIHFNISHCRGMVACGIDHRRIGVDVELIRPYSNKLCDKVLSEKEREEAGAFCTPEVFFRYWTLKESYVKATGSGLSVPMKSVTFTWKDGGGSLPAGDLSANNITCSRPGFEFFQTCLRGAYVLSICVEKSPAQQQKRRGGYHIYDLSGSI